MLTLLNSNQLAGYLKIHVNTESFVIAFISREPTNRKMDVDDSNMTASEDTSEEELDREMKKLMLQMKKLRKKRKKQKIEKLKAQLAQEMKG